MQLSKNISLASVLAISAEAENAIDITKILDKLDDSYTASMAKGDMLHQQQNPPPDIKANMQKLAERLDAVAEKMIAGGFGFEITSGYRAPLLNKAVRGKRNSAHLRGLAADIRFTSMAHAKALIDALIEAGFKRIGLGSIFIHADLDNTLPSPACWIYSAKFKTPTWLQAWEGDIENRLK